MSAPSPSILHTEVAYELCAPLLCEPPYPCPRHWREVNRHAHHAYRRHRDNPALWLDALQAGAMHTGLRDAVLAMHAPTHRGRPGPSELPAVAAKQRRDTAYAITDACKKVRERHSLPSDTTRIHQPPWLPEAAVLDQLDGGSTT